MKERLRKRLSRLTDLPESSFGCCPYVAIEGNSSVKVDACLEILSYEDDAVRLLLTGMIAVVRGKGLTLRSYGDRSIRITGRIDGVDLTEKKDGRRGKEEGDVT